MEPIPSLAMLGIREKAARVYFATLEHGPAAVRSIAAAALLNRQTTYDLLKELMANGLVSYYHADKKQYFVAEDPEKLLHLANLKRTELETCTHQLTLDMPQLRSIFRRPGEKPVTKFYEGAHGVATILRDVLETAAGGSPPEYLAYSSRDIRDDLYKGFPNFTEERIRRHIAVRVLAVGGGGGTDSALADRRVVAEDIDAPTYRIIYGAKTAFISANRSGMMVGVTIEDTAVAQTERVLFEALWAASATHV